MYKPMPMEWYGAIDRRTLKVIDLPFCSTYEGKVYLWETLLNIDETLTPNDVYIFVENDGLVYLNVQS